MKIVCQYICCVLLQVLISIRYSLHRVPAFHFASLLKRIIVQLIERSISYVYIHTEGSPTNFVRKREERMLPRLIKAVLERVTIPKRERAAR